MRTMKSPARTPLRGFLRLILRQPIWAIPFAIFFRKVERSRPALAPGTRSIP